MNLINEVNNVLLLNTKHVEKGRDVTRLQTSSQSLSSVGLLFLSTSFLNTFRWRIIWVMFYWNRVSYFLFFLL